MDIGYAVTTTLVAVAMVVAVRPLAHSGFLGVVSWLVSDLVVESPFLGMSYLLVASLPAVVAGTLFTTAVVPWLLVAGASFVVTPVLLSRSLAAGAVLQHAGERAMGRTWGTTPGPVEWRRRLPWHRIILAPLPVLALGVRRRRGLRYGPARRHRLDVYRGRGPDVGRPVLIHLHGGGFRSGRKSFYARALLHAFARHGWVCISASHRLRPASYADMLADVGSVLTWTRRNIADHGGDRDAIVIAGSSSGAHLAVTAALSATASPTTPDERGIASAIRAVIGLYGYYGPADRGRAPTQPAAHAHPDAPAVFIIHGAQDTFVPPEPARRLASTVRSVSTQPVLYAELPGAQHSFDLLHSIRFHLVIDALWTFTAHALQKRLSTEDAVAAT